MKSYLIEYKGKLELEKFLQLHPNIQEAKSILVQVFSGIVDENIILGELRSIQELIPQATIIGATTDGEIINGSYQTHSIVMSITIFEKSEVIPFCYSVENDYFLIGEKVAQNAPKDTKCIITFSDGLNANGEDYIKGIATSRQKFIVAGGMAGTYDMEYKTFVFCNDFISEKGVVGVYLKGESLIVHNEYIFGWMDIGLKLKITKAQKNRIYQIEGKSAYSIYKKYLGVNIAKNLPAIGVEFPLIIKRNGRSIARAVMKKNPDGSLVFAGNIENGEIVKFSIANINSIFEDINKKIKKISQYPIESMFIYSCMARRRFLKELINKELEVLNRIHPISGFYTFGEFFSSQEEMELHNETTTILMLSEDRDSIKKQDIEVVTIPVSKDICAFNHLLKAIKKDLESINLDLSHLIYGKKSFQEDLFKDNLTKSFNLLKLKADLKKRDFHYLVVLNIDNFTKINSLYGIEIGDRLLQEVANRLMELEGDVYRISGDEFALLVEDYQKAIEDIKHSFLSIPIYINSIPFFIAFSFGVAQNAEGQDILHNALFALKEAKSKGKHRVEIFKRECSSDLNKESIAISAKLMDALKHDGVILYYQAILDNRSKKIAKYEALIRFKVENSIYGPYNFLQEAKVLGLMPQLTQIVIDKAFQYFSKNSVEFSINISDEDLEDRYFIDYLIKKSQEYKIDPTRVYLEVLENIESLAASNIDRVQKLKEYGFKIAIDDFGSMYSNFARLQAIQADIIKIDGQYIKDLDKNQRHQKIVRAIIALAKEFEMEVVAEFVHNKTIQEIVESLGIDYSQGYYISIPKESIE